MKKKVLIIMIVLVICCIAILHIYGDNILLFINWNIWLPKPEKKIELFSSESRGFQDGESFEIWNFNQSKLEKIINDNHFMAINNQDLKPILDRYYYYLSPNNRIIFSQNFNAEKLLESNNYYAYFNDTNHSFHFLIMILDMENKNLYYLLIY